MNRSERLALLVLQIGAVAVVLAASTHRGFDLDRFLIPKELVLHAAAMLAGFFALDGLRRGMLTKVDLLLIGYLLLSAIAAVFATNHWLAGRALAISVSSVLVFWIARSLGNPRPLVNVLAIAVVLVAITSLLQAYGIWIDLFSQNRAPGGTLGNRNFIAHAAAFGMPVVLLAALQGRWFASVGVTVVTASLVLTRSRAAWLAFAAAALVFAIAIVLSRALRSDGRTWRRLAVVLLLVGGGVAAALLIPNTLNWRSDNPYLESVQGVVNYQDGSGRGRLIQYERSLRMAARHPLFGVGPGNWAVEYPEHAPASDPSIDTSDSGMTINPWPSSDWVAFASERGFLAAAVLAIALVMLAWSSLKRLTQTQDVDEALMATALIATMAGACVAGAFDAVLLLALPSFLVWATLGALAPRADVAEAPSRALFVAGAALVVFALLASARSATQLAAMELFTRGDRASLRRAARVDPGNYRVHMRLARAGGRGRCEHALAALSLYPHAQGSKGIASGCLGVRGR